MYKTGIAGFLGIVLVFAKEVVLTRDCAGQLHLKMSIENRAAALR